MNLFGAIYFSVDRQTTRPYTLGMTFIDALRQELHQVEGELEKDPKFRRAKRIRELLAEYEGIRSVPVAAGQGAGKFAQIKQELTQLLQVTSSLHRKDLLDHLVKAGLMGHESDPMASLAHYLSTSGHFKSVGNGYWSLK
jgi:hypothetical protein